MPEEDQLLLAVAVHVAQGEEIALYVLNGTAVQLRAVRQDPLVVGGLQDLGEGVPGGLVSRESGGERLCRSGGVRGEFAFSRSGNRRRGVPGLRTAGGEGQKEGGEKEKGA